MKARVSAAVGVCRSFVDKVASVSPSVLLSLSALVLASLPTTASAQTTLPASIRAADFDNGANGVSFYDTSSGNNGGYYRATDVDIEACAEGGVNVGWVSAGEWLNYTVTVPTSGSYTLDLRVSSVSGARLNVQFGGTNKTGSVTIPATGGWQSWTTVSTTVNLSAGVQVMRVAFETGGVNIASVAVRGGGSGGAGPSGGASFPGTVEAEDFDSGANGTAYWDTTSGNNGGAHRNTDVDLEGSSEGGSNVGWTAAGEWLHYTVNVQAAGTYNLGLRVASSGGGRVYVLFGGSNKTGTISVPGTGGWQSWTTVNATVNLSAGTQVMRIVFEDGGINLNSISVTSGSAPSGPSGPAESSPFTGAAAAIPGTIQAEAFDSGGQGVAYRDNSSGNSGGAYRSTDVDIEAGASGHAVGWIGAGEWLQYTVDPSSSGDYVMTARVASAGSGGTFHIEANGVNRGTIRIPDTGWWGNYQDVQLAMYLDAGVQQVRVVFDSNGSSGAVGNLDHLRFDKASSAPTTPPPSSNGGKLRVMTWNIAFGADPWGQARVIADSGADVVALQEVSLWDEDMRVTYPQRLKQLTGQTWYSVFASHSGRYSPNEGTMLLSRLPIVDQSTHNSYDRGYARVLVSVGGVQVNVFSLHLDWYDTNMRTNQLEDFMWWARQFGGPRLVGADMNSWWGEYWISRMTQEYNDTWPEVKGTTEGGYSLNGSVRFDYLFRNDPNNRAMPSDIWVTSSGYSDHAPVIADYSIR
jgi:endonuclease/exonuclease/phosphatase family metal-dependent hydrolase